MIEYVTGNFLATDLYRWLQYHVFKKYWHTDILFDTLIVNLYRFNYFDTTTKLTFPMQYILARRSQLIQQ